MESAGLDRTLKIAHLRSETCSNFNYRIQEWERKEQGWPIDKFTGYLHCLFPALHFFLCILACSLKRSREHSRRLGHSRSSLCPCPKIIHRMKSSPIQREQSAQSGWSRCGLCLPVPTASCASWDWVTRGVTDNFASRAPHVPFHTLSAFFLPLFSLLVAQMSKQFSL